MIEVKERIETIKEITDLRKQVSLINERINEFRKQIYDKHKEALGKSEELLSDLIKEYFYSECGLAPDLLFSSTRKADYVFARQVAQYWLLFHSKMIINNSLKRIGNITGGRDHSTVIHAKKCIEDYLVIDRKRKGLINYHIENLNSLESLLAEKYGL